MGFAVTTLGLSLATSAGAGGGPRAVLVKNVGAESVRVKVFSVEGAACETGHQLYAGTIPAGEGVSFGTPAPCVCAAQTTADTDDSPWSKAKRFCQPQICQGGGSRDQKCVVSPDPVIRILVDQAPGK